ncbi:hypothetical protein GDO86_007614 [Hymenochirus boettgeri]|uniref:Kinesin-like protein KIF14 n=1 Tax=Hymenochirus boettgeri TaxID=247094 RepID=A0A8T2IZW0_9PIPI|nr:hypothetical protein GDO86_007614 [Hymenochirus boettgeri]
MALERTTIKSHLDMYGVSSEKTSQVNPNAAHCNFGISLRKGTVGANNVEALQKSVHCNKTRDINKTYVISAFKNTAALPKTSKTEGRLTLQRRERSSKGSLHVEKVLDTNINVQDRTERGLTLQRRLRTGSIESDEKKKIAEEHLTHSHPNENQGLAHSYSNASANITGKNSCKDSGEGCKQLHSQTSVGSVKLKNCQEEEHSKQTNCALGIKDNGLLGIKSNGKVGCLQKGQEPKTPVSKTLDQKKMLLCSGSGLSRSSSIRNTSSPVITPKRIVGTLGPSSKKVSNSVKSLYLGQTEKTPAVHLPSNAFHPKIEPVTISCSPDDDHPRAENCAVTVAVRVRPFSKRERSEKALQVVFMNGQETIVQHPDSKQNHIFCYDFSFWSFEKSHSSYAGQELVYQKLAIPLLEWSLFGYNTCLFAYGQTGSGKSYTMMGFDEEPGIFPRFCADLFLRIQATMKQLFSFHLEISYFEVYNEKIHDLLNFKADSRQKKQPLRVREHPLIGPYVEDLSMYVVSSFQDIQSWLELGNKQRATAATGMNDKSSRSHSVFTLILTQTKTEHVDGQEHDHRITSRINLVDLAGSERCSSAQTSGERLKEGVSINKSLLTLGKVISALSENSQMPKKTFIPYRESVLTWLLKESLGGNSKTAMIATISPALTNLEETLSTLRYAKQARLIINLAKVNEDVNTKMIRELKAEIEKLKSLQLSAKNKDSDKYKRSQQEITSLKLQLSQQEREMCELKRAWKNKLEQADERKRDEIIELQKAGIAFKMDNRLPNLVNLNEDPQLSEMLLYMIKEGQTTVGKNKAGSSHDIQLSGALIAENHCIIMNNGNTVSITPSGDARTFVNGNQISASTILHHGDRVILGGDHYFRFNHPLEVHKQNATSQTFSTLEGPKDFEFAKNELLTAQQTQLEEEIEEARLRAKEEMMRGIQIAKEMAQQELTYQKSAYEDKIKALEEQLNEESRQKQLQEMNSQRAANRIQELEEVKVHLQQEVRFNKQRLEMETLATKQALDDHSVRHAKILEALEAEKQKIAREVQILQQDRYNRDNNQPTWNNMKLSMMIQEANTISSRLKKHTVFNRHEITDKENVPTNPVQIQVKNLKLGIVTFWSVEKFEYKLAAMKDMYENNVAAKDDDVFYDPEDEWEPDLSNRSISNLSRRKSLLKNRRISGCLYEIRVHPIQSLQSGYKSGFMNKSSSFLSSSSCASFDISESHLPGICKDLIGSSLDFLGRSHVDDINMADSLINSVKFLYIGVHAVSQAYEQQKEDSTDVLFLVNREVQFHSVQMTSAFQQMVMLNKHWICNFLECVETANSADNLSLCIKKLGGYLQLLLQGCYSDISSMVKEAREKSVHIVEQILQSIGHLAVLTDTEIHTLEKEENDFKSLQKTLSDSICEGLHRGLQSLGDSLQNTVDEVQICFKRCIVQDKVHSELKERAINLTTFLQKCLADCKRLDLSMIIRDSAFSAWRGFANALRNLRSSLERFKLSVISPLEDIDAGSLITLIEDTIESAYQINRNLPSVSPQIICVNELRAISKSLIQSVCREQGNGSYSQDTHHQNLCTDENNALSPSAIQWV